MQTLIWAALLYCWLLLFVSFVLFYFFPRFWSLRTWSLFDFLTFLLFYFFFFHSRFPSFPILFLFPHSLALLSFLFSVFYFYFFFCFWLSSSSLVKSIHPYPSYSSLGLCHCFFHLATIHILLLLPLPISLRNPSSKVSIVSNCRFFFSRTLFSAQEHFSHTTRQNIHER